MLETANCSHDSIHARRARMEHFFDKSNDGLIFHVNGIITDANPALSRMSGFSTDEIIGSNVFQWITPQYHDLVKRNMARGTEDMYEIALIHKTGPEIPVYLRHVNALVNGKHERLVVVQDIHELKEAQQTQREIEQQVHLLSNYDLHTGMPNLRYFNLQLENLIQQHRKEQQRFAVVHINVERMKMFNEIFSRTIGDQLLSQWASRLRDILSNTVTDHCARINGIGFAVAIPYIKDANSVVQLVKQLRKKLEAPYQVEQHQIDNLKGSYGIAFFPDDANNVESLLSRAETACSHAKRAGNESINCFSHEMNIHSIDKFKFEMRLKDSLDRHEMALYYQPKVDTLSQKVVEYEALIRWIDPDHGLVSPAEFIPLAEETGLIIPIGEWVIWTACKQLAWLQQQPGDTPKISINLSSLQFTQSNLVGIVQQALTLFELPPGLLDLELTESAVMNDVDTSINILNKLKALGVSISIDDFGTGYSSLSYLKRFPIDTLKIDRSFVVDITSNQQDKSIAKAIIALAKSLELATVAEGVETNEQLEILREIKCDLVQGYLFGKPLPAKQAFAR